MIDSTIIVALIGAGALLGSPFVQELSKKIVHTSSPNYENDGKIDNFVYYLRHKYGCQRLYVIAYHNGGTYYTGNSIDKFTIKHESVDAYTQPLMPLMQGVTTTMLKEMPDMIRKSGVFVEGESLKLERINKPAYVEVMKQHNIHSTLSFAVYRNIFKMNKLKSDKEMIYSIHLDWKDNKWFNHILSDSNEKISLIQDLFLLSDMLDNKRIKTPEYLEILGNYKIQTI